MEEFDNNPLFHDRRMNIAAQLAHAEDMADMLELRMDKLVGSSIELLARCKQLNAEPQSAPQDDAY